MNKSFNEFFRMNQDSEHTALAPNEYIYAMAIKHGVSEGYDKAIINHKGNELIEFELPEGDNICIGRAADIQNQRIYYFLYNSNKFHRICSFDTFAKTITLLYENEPTNDLLNFSPTGYITQCGVIDSQLVWTDGINPPRQLDVERALTGSFYTNPKIAEYIDFAKTPPNFPPTCKYQQDLKIRQNYVSGKLFQFAYRFTYINNEKSTISPYSKVIIDQSSFDKKYSTNNYVLVDYGTNLLGQDLPIKTDANFRKLIKYVEILVRGTDYNGTSTFDYIQVNAAPFRVVARIDDSIIENYTYRFYNNEVYSLLPSADYKLYESIPLVSQALAAAENRIFLGNNKEDYDLVDIDIALDIDFNDYGIPQGSENPDDYDAFYNLTPFDRFDSYQETCSTQDPPFSCNCFAQRSVEVFRFHTFEADVLCDITLIMNLLNVSVLPLTTATTVGGDIMGSNAFFTILKNNNPILFYQVIDEMTVINQTATNIPFAEGDILTIEFRYTVGGYQIINVGQVDEYYVCILGTVNIELDSGTLDINVTQVTTIVPTEGVLKRGGTYQYGLVYYDKKNRYSIVNAYGNVLINGNTQTNNQATFALPFITEDIATYFDNFTSPYYKYGTPKINWEINHKPPIWATHYAWVRTKNTAYARFIQWQIQQVLYVVKYDVDSDGNLKDTAVVNPTVGTIPATANEIYLSIENFAFFQEQFTDSILSSWVPEPNDRLRCIATYIATYVGSTLTFYTSLLDFPIKGIRGKWIVIDAKAPGLPFFKQGDIVEFYTPKLSSQELQFYEINEIFPILNPHTPDRLHAKGYNGNDQTLTTPATGTFKSGDIFYRERKLLTKEITPGQEYTKPYPTYVQEFGNDKVVIKEVFVETTNLSDFFFSTADDTGRLAIFDKDIKQEQRKSEIRFGGNYVADTAVNRLNNFEGLNVARLPIENGSITGLIVVSNSQAEGNVMLALMHHATMSIYIGKAVLQQQGGGQITAIANQIIANTNTLQGNHGCQNVESIVAFNNYAYWFDAMKGNALRYASNGISIISANGMGNYHKKQRDMLALLPKQQRAVFGGFDSFLNNIGEFILAFKHNNETLAFEEDNNRYTSFYPYFPEMFANLGQTFISFRNGALWLHHSDTPDRSTFYGEFVAPKIQFVNNEASVQDKIYRAISVLAYNPESPTNQNFWHANEFKTNRGNESVLLTSDYNKFSNYGFTPNDFKLGSFFVAPILRDINTPNTTNPIIYGDELQGNNIIITATTNSTNLAVLRLIEIRFIGTSFLGA